MVCRATEDQDHAQGRLQSGSDDPQLWATATLVGRHKVKMIGAYFGGLTRLAFIRLCNWSKVTTQGNTLLADDWVWPKSYPQQQWYGMRR